MRIALVMVFAAFALLGCRGRPHLPSVQQTDDLKPEMPGETPSPSDPMSPPSNPPSALDPISQTPSMEELKPIRPTLHRLNRAEYDNAVKDVFGIDFQLAKLFPADPVTGGFDNVAESLSLSPSLADLLHQSAQTIANKVVDNQPRSFIDIDPSLEGKGQKGTIIGNQFSIDGTFVAKFKLEFDERMSFSFLLGGEAYMAEIPKAQIKMNDKVLGEYEIKAESNYPKAYDFNLDLKKGEHTITIVFTNRSSRNPVTGTFNYLVLSRITAKSAQDATSKIILELNACAKSQDAPSCKALIYQSIAERAWRRPLSASEILSFKKLWDATIKAKGTETDAMRNVVQAIILSTKFLYRTSTPVSGGKSILELDDFTIASRLSFFLWSSLPDKELLDAALDGDLRSSDSLKSEIKRMLKDPKAERFIKNFASQWLHTRLLEKATPDPAVFPNFSNGLKNSMTLESELVFADFLTNGRDINDLLKPGFTFADAELAKHYGLKHPGGTGMTRIETPNDERGGILSHGAWLTVTSLPNDTMPVKRGVWVMENVLCQAIAAPPAVPALEAPLSDKPETVRERFARHLKDPACAACHNVIDPLGFGLEAFDATGAARTLDSAGKAVDTEGTIGGTNFQDYDGMVKAIADSGKFKRCLTRKIYSYALGRVPEKIDDENVDAIISQFSKKDLSLLDLIHSIVLSPAFRKADFSEDL